MVRAFVSSVSRASRQAFWRTVRACFIGWTPKHHFREHVSLITNDLPIGYLSTRGKVVLYGWRWRWMHHFGRID